MKSFLQKQWKFALGINFLLGVALWIGLFTDVSLRGTISDILFPPVVAIIAIGTIQIIPSEWKRISKIGLSLSYIGGCLFLLIGCIMLIPPFTLGFLFGISEITSEVRIQQIASPDDMRLAEVYFRPVGAYSGGSGRIYVRIRNRFLPFVERDIYYLRVSHADENTKNYVKWNDNNTLYISETNEQLSIGKVKSDLPTLAIVPLLIVGFFQNQVRESQLTAPLNDIPIYPSKVEHDSTSHYESIGETRRVFFLPEANLDDVYKWYSDTLSQSPWEIIDTNILLSQVNRSLSTKDRYDYCIKARRTLNNQEQIFYWEIRDIYGPAINAWDVRVIAYLSDPHSPPCEHLIAK